MTRPPVHLRVHGVGGPTAESVLCQDRGSEQLWRHDRFGRASLRIGSDPDVAVYHWAPLTSGSRWFVFWPFLLPFTVINVAGWMHPPGRRASVARALAGLVALGSTAFLTGWSVIASQVLLRGDGTWKAWLGWFLALVALVAVVLLAVRSQHGFEEVEPPAQIARLPKSSGLRDPSFFARARRRRLTLALHVVAILGTFIYIAWRAESSSVASAADTVVTVIGAVEVGLLVLLALATVHRGKAWSLSAFTAAAAGVALISGFMSAWLMTAVGVCPHGAPATTADCSRLSGGAFALVDVYGWALLVTLGVAAMVVVGTLSAPAPGEHAAKRADLLPGLMATMRARVAVIPSRIIVAATTGAVVFVALSAVLFPLREPATVHRWCDSMPVIEDSDWPCTALPDDSGEPWRLTSSAPVTVARWTFFGLLTFLVINLLKSRGDFVKLRRISSIWDVVTFWPRAFHPFAVRPYAERAVPELQHLLVDGVDDWRGQEMHVWAHSQGSVLVVAAVAPLAGEDGAAQLMATSLLTFGSPIRTLYQRAFPAYFDDSLVRSVHDVRLWEWRNVFKFTDHIGRAVFVDDADWEGSNGDRGLSDPGPDGGPIRGHSGYWDDARLPGVEANDEQ